MRTEPGRPSSPIPLRYHPASTGRRLVRRPVTNQWGIPWPNESIDTSTDSVDRRNFLKGAAAGAAGAAGAIVSGTGVRAAGRADAARPSVARPTEADARADFVPPEPRVGAPFIQHPGSDYMVDVLKALDFDYVAVNPGSAFEGLHESIINHGGNRKPEILTVLHEEAGAAIAHGYAKAAGKPMMTLMHGTVGLLHASMGLFQAWCDRVPVFAIVGHARNPTSVVNRPHSAQDMGSIVRDFMKMDDEPTNLERVRQHRDARLHDRPHAADGADAARRRLGAARSADSRSEQAHGARGSRCRACRKATRAPCAKRRGCSRRAERPLIRTGKLARTSAGWDRAHRARRAAASARRRRRLRLVARLPVVARAVRLGRPRLPARRDPRPRAQRHDGIGARRARRGRQDDQHLLRVSLAGSQHPRLRQLLRGRRRDRRRRRSDAAVADRGDPQAERRQRRAASARRAARRSRRRTKRSASARSTTRATAGTAARSACRAWSPSSGGRFRTTTGRSSRAISSPAVAAAPAESRQVLSLQRRLRRLRHRLRHAGVRRRRARAPRARPAARSASSATATSTSSARARSGRRRTTRFRCCSIIHNNRAYHAEVMLVQRTAARRGRGNDKVDIGNVIRDPAPDYAKIAQGYGVYAEGPIERSRRARAGARARARARARRRAGVARRRSRNRAEDDSTHEAPNAPHSASSAPSRRARAR